MSQIKGFKNVAQAVRHQCELYNGSGGPDQLKGEMIPLASRIIAVDNAFDEELHRAVRPIEISQEHAVAVLESGSVQQFYPSIVQLLVEMIEHGDNQLLANSEVEMSPKQLKPGMVSSRDLEKSDGVLLLSAGTELTLEYIAKIQELTAEGLWLSGVCVRCVLEETNDDGKDTTADAA